MRDRIQIRDVEHEIASLAAGYCDCIDNRAAISGMAPGGNDGGAKLRQCDHGRGTEPGPRAGDQCDFPLQQTRHFDGPRKPGLLWDRASGGTILTCCVY